MDKANNKVTKECNYILFSFLKQSNLIANLIINHEYKIAVFEPSIFRLKIGKFRDWKELILHIIWYLTGYKIVYVFNKNEIIHYSYLMSSNYKCSFMGKKDLEIGPCYTEENYRGQRIFPFIISFIVKTFGSADTQFYMLTHINNIASQKGIARAGFQKIGLCQKNFMGIYRLEMKINSTAARQAK